MSFGFGMGFPRASSAAGGPSLNLQFAGSTTLDPSITFTRASSGSYYNSAGVLTLAGTNVPRLDYNPSTLQPQGLLIEEARTNLFTYSQQFDNVLWGKTNATVAADSATAPDGTLTADKIVPSAVATFHFISQTGGTASATETQSVYAKAGGYDWLRLSIGTTLIVWFNVASGTVGTITGTVVPVIQPVGNGWYRCSISGVRDASTNNVLMPSPSDNVVSYTGDGTSGVHVWGAQLEAGAFATSYIPTVAAAATRAQDFASITTLTPWYNATEGTLMAVATPYSPGTSTIKILVALDDGTFAQRSQIVKASGTSFVNGVVTVGTAVYAGSVATAWAIDTVGKAALAYKSSDNKIAFNGVLDTVATSTAGVPTVTKLAIGARYDGGTPWSGAISAITYYPRRLSDTELQSITA